MILACAEGRVPGGPKWRGRPIRLLSFFLNSFFFSFSYFVFFFLFFILNYLNPTLNLNINFSFGLNYTNSKSSLGIVYF
jgi:hypothetical protein